MVIFYPVATSTVACRLPYQREQKGLAHALLTAEEHVGNEFFKLKADTSGLDPEAVDNSTYTHNVDRSSRIRSDVFRHLAVVTFEIVM